MGPSNLDQVGSIVCAVTGSKMLGIDGVTVLLHIREREERAYDFDQLIEGLLCYVEAEVGVAAHRMGCVHYVLITRRVRLAGEDEADQGSQVWRHCTPLVVVADATRSRAPDEPVQNGSVSDEKVRRCDGVDELHHLHIIFAQDIKGECHDGACKRPRYHRPYGTRFSALRFLGNSDLHSFICP